jgi:hypothetical protein
MRALPLLNQLHVSEPRRCHTMPSLPAPDHLLCRAPWHEPNKRAPKEQPVAVVLHDLPSSELRLCRILGGQPPVPGRASLWRTHATDGLILLPLPELPGNEAQSIVLHGCHGHESVPDKMLQVRVQPEPFCVPWGGQPERCVASDVQPHCCYQ